MAQLQERVDQLQTELAQCREALKTKSTKVNQLEGKKISEDILTEGVTRELEKVCDSVAAPTRMVCVCVCVGVVWVCVGVCGVSYSHYQLASWSSGMILA